jgi:SOS-response transcriptional repressor LexA/DNA-binding XRE family transcriptional regulator
LPDIKDRIITVREALGLRQSKFADILDVKRTTLIGYENGTSPPSTDFLVKLHEKYDVRIDWLLTGKGQMLLSESEKIYIPPKHPLVQEIENLLERLSTLETSLKKGESSTYIPETPDSGMFVSEPEPEYGEVEDDVTFVEGIAAGKPVFQSEARSTIPVPRRFITTKPEDYYVGRIKGTSMTSAGIPDGVLVLIRYSDTPRDGAIQVVEHQGEATLKRMREIPGKGWKICFEDGSGRFIPIGPGDEFHIQGDFVAVLPED